MQEVARVAAAILVTLAIAGCAAQTGQSSQDSGKPSWMPNMPFATDSISVACAACSEFGCSAVAGPMP